MINYTTNQRRSLRYDASGNWQEEVLAASGVAVESGTFSLLSGDDAQETFQSIDNILTSLELPVIASGIVMIQDVISVSGMTSDTLGGLEVITTPSGANSIFKFSFTVPALPLVAPTIRIAVAPRGASASGILKFDYSYNIFSTGDDLTPGSYEFSPASVTQTFTGADFEELKLVNLPITAAHFSSGTAPYILDVQITRNTSVSGNYPHNISIVSIIVDNVPGGMIGNQAGYVGGNLVVDGDLTVSGMAIFQSSMVPASGSAAGISGSLVFDSNFLYIAPDTNTWKRININGF